jgi:hypothetical protein
LDFWHENAVVIGQNLFATEPGGFAIEDWDGYTFDCTIATPSNESCTKTTEIPCLLNDSNGDGGLQNTRVVNHIGNNYRPLQYEEYHYMWDDIALAQRNDIQPSNIDYEPKVFDMYDIPFPTLKIVAQNGSGYSGSAGTRFFTGQGETWHPWFLQYRNYYGAIRYDENVTKQYRVTTPLGEMLSTELYSYFIEYTSGDTEYIIRKFTKAQGLAAGQYVEKGFCQIYLMQYRETITTKARDGIEGSINQNRVVIFQAQTMQSDSAGTTSPHNIMEQNSTLTAALNELVSAWYSGNGLSATDLVEFTLTVEMVA